MVPLCCTASSITLRKGTGAAMSGIDEPTNSRVMSKRARSAPRQDFIRPPLLGIERPLSRQAYEVRLEQVYNCWPTKAPSDIHPAPHRSYPVSPTLVQS